MTDIQDCLISIHTFVKLLQHLCHKSIHLFKTFPSILFFILIKNNYFQGAFEF